LIGFLIPHISLNQQNPAIAAGIGVEVRVSGMGHRLIPNIDSKQGSGAGKIIVVLYACDIVLFAAVTLFPTIVPLGAVLLIAWILIAYYVNKDANQINAELGKRELPALTWSIFTFLLSFIAVPLYLLIPRRQALSKNQTTGPRPQLSPGILVLGLFGLFVLVGGINENIHPPDFSVFQAYAFELRLIPIGLGAVLLSASAGLYLSRKKREP
jgi:hypothetical protein